jgi:hypothetical protein
MKKNKNNKKEVVKKDEEVKQEINESFDEEIERLRDYS